MTKIVRALWLAERRVCMRVCKHGCDVKVYCFSRANHASTNLKTLLSWQLDKFTHCPFPFRLKLVTSLQKCSVDFFRLSWHFKRQKSLFLESIFLAKQELITVMVIIIIKYRLWRQLCGDRNSFLVAILFGQVRGEGTGALIRKGLGWTLIRGRRLF